MWLPTAQQSFHWFTNTTQRLSCDQMFEVLLPDCEPFLCSCQPFEKGEKNCEPIFRMTDKKNYNCEEFCISEPLKKDIVCLTSFSLCALLFVDFFLLKWFTITVTFMWEFFCSPLCKMPSLILHWPCELRTRCQLKKSS